MKRGRSFASQITSTPALVLQGLNDRFAKPEGSAGIYETLGCMDEQLVMAQTGHLIFEGRQAGENGIILVNWMMKHGCAKARNN
jgi:hypothetical protein